MTLFSLLRGSARFSPASQPPAASQTWCGLVGATDSGPLLCRATTHCSYPGGQPGFTSCGSTGMKTGSLREMYTSARLTPTGHLIAARPGQLLAIPFDQNRWEITGGEIPVVTGLRTDSWGAAHFSFSRDGTLVYVQGPPGTAGELVSFDRTGSATPVPGFGVDNYGAFRLSPTGNRLAITVSAATSELWVRDLARGTRIRLNAAAGSGYPLWTPDGNWVTFGASTGGAWNTSGSALTVRGSRSDCCRVKTIRYRTPGRQMAACSHTRN